MSEATPFLPGLSPVAGKPLTATFDAGRLSSDGGLVLLREIEARLGLAQVLVAPLADTRDPSRVIHSYAAMVRARMLAIAAGYEDGDDLDLLRSDPAFKVGLGRAPESGLDLMSQPTISRLENTASWRQLARIGLGLIDLFCKSYAAAPERIELDIDDTVDAVHGGQQLALFHGHYGTRCFLPIVVFEAISGKPITALLRPGKTPSGAEIARVLRHVIARIRKHWPNVAILVRADSHYCAPEALDLLEKKRCDYILGLAVNTRLSALAAPWKERCAGQRTASRPTVRHVHRFTYAARSWERKRTVIARIEATSIGTDARFVVTNLQGRSRVLYEKVYCARGRMENLIKDMKLYTRSDKTACHRWQANQFRLFLHIGAYWLLHSLRRAAPKRSPWRGATFETIRRAVVKVAVRIEEMKSRIKIALPASYPHRALLIALTGAITAQAP